MRGGRACGWPGILWNFPNLWIKRFCHSIRLFHLYSDDAGNGGGGRAAGDGDHVEASGAAGHGFVLFEGQRAGTGSRPNAGALGNRTVKIQSFSPAFPLTESPDGSCRQLNIIC